MSAEHLPIDQAPATPTGAMIRTLGLVSAICGLIIVGAYQGTYDAVAANKRIAMERAVFKVVPAAETPAGAIRFFAGYDEAGKLVGVAAEGSARGYADIVRVMFGYDPACQCVRNIGVVSMRETPGIGDKILVDRAFLENFKELDARLTADMKALANEIKTVKHGSKTGAWQIDAIAGATITSRAVGKAINDSAQALLPRLVPNLDKLGSKS